MLILSDEDFPAVRAALDISIDDQVLPDDIIALPMFIDTAEDEVVRRVSPTIPAWVDLTGSPRLHLHNAVIKLVAAMLAPRMPDIVSETFASGGQIYKRQPMNWNQVSARLTNEYEEELQMVINPEGASTDEMATVFTAVRGYPGYRPHYTPWWGP